MCLLSSSFEKLLEISSQRKNMESQRHDIAPSVHNFPIEVCVLFLLKDILVGVLGGSW